jgi:hypothetical protein
LIFVFGVYIRTSFDKKRSHLGSAFLRGQVQRRILAKVPHVYVSTVVQQVSNSDDISLYYYRQQIVVLRLGACGPAHHRNEQQKKYGYGKNRSWLHGFSFLSHDSFPLVAEEPFSSAVVLLPVTWAPVPHWKKLDCRALSRPPQPGTS